jgi:hypothetical protein
MKAKLLILIGLFLLTPIALAEDINVRVNVVSPTPLPVNVMDITKIVAGISTMLWIASAFLMSPRNAEELIITMIIIIVVVLVLAWFFSVAI